MLCYDPRTTRTEEDLSNLFEFNFSSLNILWKRLLNISSCFTLIACFLSLDFNELGANFIVSYKDSLFKKGWRYLLTYSLVIGSYSSKPSASSPKPISYKRAYNSYSKLKKPDLSSSFAKIEFPLIWYPFLKLI